MDRYSGSRISCLVDARGACAPNGTFGGARPSPSTRLLLLSEGDRIAAGWVGTSSVRKVGASRATTNVVAMTSPRGDNASVQTSHPAVPSQAPVPSDALTCPRCRAPAEPSGTVQSCSRCHGTFTLRSGARLDKSVVVPPIDPGLSRIQTRSAGLVLRKANILTPEGVLHGTLDPVTGMIPIDQSGILFSDVFTIAVWRSVDVPRLVLGMITIVPLALFLLFLSLQSAFVLVVAIPMTMLSAYLIHRTTVTRKNFARIAGATRTLVVQFDAPPWRRRAFHDELLRRSGISHGPIP